MTREEFIEIVDCFCELINMDQEYGIGVCDELVLGEDLDEAISNDFRYTDYGWVDIRSWLNDIEEGYECYKRTGSFEYEYLTDSDFEDYKDELLRSMIDDGYIDDDEDEDDEEEAYYVLNDGEDDDYAEQEAPEEDIPVSDLFTICNSNFRILKNDEDDECSNSGSEWIDGLLKCVSE